MSDNIEGKDFGYHTDISNCRACKSECLNNSNCGGAECGLSGKYSGNCTWWSYESCGRQDLQTYYSPTRITCNKYSEGIIESNKIYCENTYLGSQYI